jgi:hypothetical protein
MAQEEEKKGNQFDDGASLASSNLNHINNMSFLKSQQAAQ